MQRFLAVPALLKPEHTGYHPNKVLLDQRRLWHLALNQTYEK